MQRFPHYSRAAHAAIRAPDARKLEAQLRIALCARSSAPGPSRALSRHRRRTEQSATAAKSARPQTPCDTRRSMPPSRPASIELVLGKSTGAFRRLSLARPDTLFSRSNAFRRACLSLVIPLWRPVSTSRRFIQPLNVCAEPSTFEAIAVIAAHCDLCSFFCNAQIERRAHVLAQEIRVVLR